jgi:hypothetical protein
MMTRRVVFSLLFLGAAMTSLAQPPCDVYLHDPSITPCDTAGAWVFRRVDTVRIALLPNNDSCDIEVNFSSRKYDDTCTGENKVEFRIGYWNILNCPSYQQYADSLRVADPDRYRYWIRTLHIELTNRLTESKFVEDYQKKGDSSFYCTEPPPSCAKGRLDYHYISAFISSCVEYVEARSWSPLGQGVGCWYCFVVPCNTSKCCFLHRVYCWDVATNSPRVCSWWTMSGDSVQCGGSSNFDPQEAMPDCPPPFQIIWRSGCVLFECTEP